MTQSKHTPAPWSFEIRDSYAEFKSGGNRDVCMIPCAATERGHEEIEANARLIESAPDMYEAIHKMLAETDTLKEQGLHAHVTRLELAIAKARGENE